jgi:hypothetical protein
MKNSTNAKRAIACANATRRKKRVRKLPASNRSEVQREDVAECQETVAPRLANLALEHPGHDEDQHAPVEAPARIFVPPFVGVVGHIPPVSMAARRVPSGA